MKQKIIFIFLSVFFIAGAFASGQNDNRYPGPQTGPGMSSYQYQDQELVEISGTLELINGTPPFLNSNSKRYSLMVPQHLLYNLDIKNGEEVTIKGYEMPNHMWQWDDTSMSLYVTNATIKGEEYDLSNNYGGHMMGGNGYGGHMRGGRRGRGCW